MTEKHKKINLALPGGGAHGAFTWGVLDEILADGRLDIDGITACSAGSLNATVLAYGRLRGGNEGAREALYKFWLKVSQGESYFTSFPTPLIDMVLRQAYFNMLDSFSRIISPYESNPANVNSLKKILLELVDFEELRKSKVTKLFLTATNVRSGAVKVFNNSEITEKSVIASASLPYLFQATEIDGEAYWDGGYSGNPAIFPLFYETDTKDVLVVHINPMRREKVPTNANEIGNRINEITFNSSLLHEFRAVAFVNKLLDDKWIKDEYRSKLKRILIHSIRADDAMKKFDVCSKFDTHWYFLTYLRDLGRAEAKEWLTKNYNSVGEKSTVNLYKDFLKLNEEAETPLNKKPGA